MFLFFTQVYQIFEVIAHLEQRSVVVHIQQYSQVQTFRSFTLIMPFLSACEYSICIVFETLRMVLHG